MEYVQERITTLHDFTGRPPPAPVDEAAIVIPMTEREHASLTTEDVLTELEALAPGRVIIVLRASADRVTRFTNWLHDFDLPLDVLWCYGDTVTALLADHGLDGGAGKGRDVWLGLGVAAATHDYVICHDADTQTYTATLIPKLLAPLTWDYTFTKGYYARVENNELYGRLCRLLVFPLLTALHKHHDAPILDYLTAFRYPLAGEFGMTRQLARSLHAERRFGLEISTLGSAYDHAGFDGSAQVDLGRHAHEHRAVRGPTGLVDMSQDVAPALLRVITDHNITPNYDALTDAYRTVARTLIRQYEADARFNGLTFDRDNECTQIDQYAAAIRPPSTDTRLPPWRETELDPQTVLEASQTDLETMA